MQRNNEASITTHYSLNMLIIYMLAKINPAYCMTLVHVMNRNKLIACY